MNIIREIYMRVGVMLCGALGCTASTLIYGYYKGRNNKELFRKGSMWCSIREDFLPETYDLVFAGWDTQKKTLSSSVKEYGILAFSNDLDIEIFSPVVGPLDYVHRIENVPVSHLSINEAIDKLKKDIRDFKNRNGVEKVIVVNLSSPMFCGENNIHGWNSATAYSLAAVSLGADWVEFTPSNSITYELETLAKESKARIAGRDGSTGQTILKLLFKDFLLNKGFTINGWYSTNIIGNHDGKVLGNADYNVEKILDKKSVLDDEINCDDHIVGISYYKPCGDNKESWDCVNFSGWLNYEMSLRLNWHGRDSILASALLLDIITCLIKCNNMNYPYGLVNDLDICFKNPINKQSNSYFEQFNNFCKFVLMD